MKKDEGPAERVGQIMKRGGEKVAIYMQRVLAFGLQKKIIGNWAARA